MFEKQSDREFSADRFTEGLINNFGKPPIAHGAFLRGKALRILVDETRLDFPDEQSGQDFSQQIDLGNLGIFAPQVVKVEDAF